MKKRRVLRMASASALLLSVGLVAACEEAVEEPVIEEPAVQEPAEPATPPQSPTIQEPAEEPADMEPAEEPGEMEQER